MPKLDLLPVLSSLVVGELAQARHVSALDPRFLNLSPGTELGSGSLETDSLDLLNLAGAVAEMFHLHETGVEEYLLRYRTLESWCEIVAVSLNKKFDRITFRTSGSTGKPKRCTHLTTDLLAEVSEHARTLGHCRRLLSLVPSHHIYGFIWTVLLPAQLGSEVIDARRWSPSRLAGELRSGDLLVGVPASWQLLSRTVDLFPSGIFGVTSGAPCPDALYTSVTEAGIQLREIYGSSETAGIGVKYEPNGPFQLLSFWSRDAGEASTNVLARTAPPCSLPTTVVAPDELLWESHRTFRVGARQDGAVQIAGTNVFPQRIAEMIQQHPNVNSCSVRLMRPEEGNRLKAFVVWKSESSPNSDAEVMFKEWLTSRLQPAEIPARFTFGASLPVNQMNKPCDW